MRIYVDIFLYAGIDEGLHVCMCTHMYIFVTLSTDTYKLK